MSMMSILGLYEFDDSLFDDMVLPDEIDRDILIENLIVELAELEVIYPDWNVMKHMIKRWSQVQIRVWKKLQELFDMDYNPIWNVDGTEREIETHDLHSAGNVNQTGADTGKVTGFNSSSLQTADQVDRTAKTTSAASDTGQIIREKTRGGNIGVTMTQQMIEAEMETRPKMNIYRYIIADFKDRFCLLVY